MRSCIWNLGHQCGHRKRNKLHVASDLAVAAGARGEGKNPHALLSVSLANVSGKTELYPIVSCPEKAFSAHRSLLSATWEWSIHALSLIQD